MFCKSLASQQQITLSITASANINDNIITVKNEHNHLLLIKEWHNDPRVKPGSITSKTFKGPIIPEKDLAILKKFQEYSTKEIAVARELLIKVSKLLSSI